MKHLKPYLKYKDSSIEWLGKIPAHWEVMPFKRHYYFSMGQTILSNELEENGHIPVVSATEGNQYFGYVSHPKFILNTGDFVIPARGISIGSVKLITIPSVCTQTTIYAKKQISTNSLESNFVVFYQMGHRKNLFQYDRTAIPQITVDQVKNNPLLIPPLLEQKKISNFLNKRTAQIDSLVKKKEKQIELLKEKRLVLITQAVTKGLNSNVKMKDSGVKWLGRIPEHWKKDRIKYSTYVKGRIGWKGLRADEFIEEGPYLITGTDFQNGKVNWDTCYHITNERYLEDPYIQLKENDLLITKDGSIGKIAMVRNLPSRASLNSGVFITRPIKNNYCNSFMYWILNSQIFNFFINYMSRGSTINHLYQNVFEMFSFPLPSKKEQRSIIKFLDKETSRIDSLIEKIENSIKLLKEYRQVLITSAVTGKIDVRESQKVKDNIIPLQISKREVHLLFKTAVLGAEIVAQMKDSPHFGRTKFMKTLYLCEVHLQMPLQGKI